MPKADTDKDQVKSIAESEPRGWASSQPGRGEEHRAQAPNHTRRSQRSRRDTTPHEIPDRDWELISIVDRKDSNGLLLYKVKWSYTKHPTAILHESNDGGQAVVVGGEVCKVLRRSTVLPDEETGEHTSVVEWPECWLSLWQLYSAFELVLEYELKHPRAPLRTQPMIAARREQWKLEPETSEGAGQEADIESVILEPELGKDYTSAFLRWQRERLESLGGLQIPGSVKWLNMPLRQRLIFNDWFCASMAENVQSYDASRDTMLKALFAFMIGDAWYPCCSHCESPDPDLPFRKCVTLDEVFNGACTNCAVTNRGSTCDLNHNTPRSPHISRCIEVHDVSTSGDMPSQGRRSDDEVLASSGTNEALPNAASVEWTSPSPTPPGSPELGSADFAGAAAFDHERLDDAVPSQRHESDDDPTKSSKRSKRRGGDHDGATKPNKPRRRKYKKMKVVKYEARIDTTVNSERLHPDTCTPGHPCRDPIAGCSPPAVKDDSVHPPHVVFNDRVFSSDTALAKDEEVQYILSRCECATTEWIQRRWDGYLDEVARGETSSLFDSKEEFLAIAGRDVLTRIVRMCCPVPSWNYGGENFIDLTSSP